MAETAPKPSPPTPGVARPISLPLVLCLGLLGVLVVGGLVLHLTAWKAYRGSFDRNETLSRRAEGATLAHRLEPFDARYETRAAVMEKWLRGSVLLSQGADLPAMLELQAAYRMDVGDSELLALFKESQRKLNLNSNYKAHIQHAHEGPGGTLRPQDLMR